MSAKNFSRIFFLFASALTALLGMLWLTLPAFLLNGWGIDAADAITLYLGQRMGALYLGLAVLFGMAARGGTGRMRSAILAGGAVGTGLMAVLSVMARSPASSAVLRSGWQRFLTGLWRPVSPIYWCGDERTAHPEESTD